MQAVLLPVPHTLSPWGDPVREARVEDTPVHALLEQTLRDAGCAEVERASGEDAELRAEGAGCVVATEDLWVTRALVRDFLKQARARTTPSILALPSDDRMVRFSATLQDLGTRDVDGTPCRIYPLAYIPPGHALALSGDLATSPPNGAEPLRIDPQTQDYDIPVHRVFSPDRKLILPLTHRCAVRIGHWMHILRANQLARLAWGSALLKERPLRLLWALLRSMSLNPARVMEKLTVRGRGCQIHPTAVVEASVLGDNVRVGANAVVRFSHLADNAVVGDACHVLYSVVGEGASIARMGMLQSCVLYPHANSGHYGLQLCVIGRDTFVGGEVILGDFKPDGNIHVMHRGALVNTHTNLLGCAMGHDCSIMMRATMYAGREVPNGYTIIGPPHDIIAKIPAGLPGDGAPLIAHHGELTPYREVLRAQAEARAPSANAQPSAEAAPPRAQEA